jgi:hypothetical protein
MAVFQVSTFTFLKKEHPSAKQDYQQRSWIRIVEQCDEVSIAHKHETRVTRKLKESFLMTKTE